MTDLDCVICLVPLVERTSLDSCKHDQFCSKCITEWVYINPSCPICRTKVENKQYPLATVFISTVMTVVLLLYMLGFTFLIPYIAYSVLYDITTPPELENVKSCDDPGTSYIFDNIQVCTIDLMHTFYFTRKTAKFIWNEDENANTSRGGVNNNEEMTQCVRVFTFYKISTICCNSSSLLASK